MRKTISIVSLSLALVTLSFSANAEGQCFNEPAGEEGVCLEMNPSGPLSGGDYYCDTWFPSSTYDCFGLPTHV